MVWKSQTFFLELNDNCKTWQTGYQEILRMEEQRIKYVQVFMRPKIYISSNRNCKVLYLSVLNDPSSDKSLLIMFFSKIFQLYRLVCMQMSSVLCIDSYIEQFVCECFSVLCIDSQIEQFVCKCFSYYVSTAIQNSLYVSVFCACGGELYLSPNLQGGCGHTLIPEPTSESHSSTLYIGIYIIKTG